MSDHNQSTLGLGADELLTTTRAVRKRLDLTRPVPRAVVDECVRIAAQAPSGRNRQQWDFVFIEDAGTKNAVADLWRRGLAAGAPGERRDVPMPTRMDFRSAQWARIAGSLAHLARHLPAFWSFMLAARERGLGTAWTTSHLTYEREMAELLGLPFDQVVQVALSPVAYTIGTTFKPGPRADAGQFTHWEHW